MGIMKTKWKIEGEGNDYIIEKYDPKYRPRSPYINCNFTELIELRALLTEIIVNKNIEIAEHKLGFKWKDDIVHSITLGNTTMTEKGLTYGQSDKLKKIWIKLNE